MASGSVISDSTTLIILQKLGDWELLSNLFETVYIPPKVLAEVSAKEQLNIDFIKLKTPNNAKIVNYLKRLLDEGESEAIALAAELAVPLIVDEKKGRKIAKDMGVEVIGFVGILLQNIRLGNISKDAGLETINKAEKYGMRISNELRELFI